MPGKGLVIDVPVIEGGTFVLAPYADRIDVLAIKKWEDFDELYNYLRADKHNYKWLAFDTITAAQVLAQRKVAKERPLDADPHMMSMQDFGKMGNLMKEFFYRFKQLPLYLILTAQERIRESAASGGLEFQPAVSPSAMEGLIPPMTLVGRLYTVEADDAGRTKVERRLRVGPHSMTVTKQRTIPGRNLPAVIKEPNLGTIFAYMLGVQGAQAPEGVLEETGFLGITIE